MPDTLSDIVLHLVWATKSREPLIHADRCQDLWNCIVGEATALGCRTLAVGGTDDHIHLLVRMRTDVTPARLAQQVKGVSSHFAKDQLGWTSLYWQEGYGVFSVSRKHVKGVADYIRNQESHHSSGGLWRCEPPTAGEWSADASGGRDPRPE